MLYDDKVIFFERLKNKVEDVLYPIQNISYIENGSILLYSWIKGSGVIDGETKSFIVEYNTVVDNIFKPIIERVRVALSDIEMSFVKEELHDFYCLSTINFKFINYAKEPY